VYVWSARGREYAQWAAAKAGLVVHCLSKPGLVLDDQGWDWTRHTRVVKVR
jgi:hypothetical protein